MCFKKVKEAKLEEQHLASPFYILLVCVWGEIVEVGGLKNTKISTEPGPWRDNWVLLQDTPFSPKISDAMA